MAKGQKVQDLGDQELKAKLLEFDEQRFRIKFQMSMGQMEGLKKVRNIRRERARILTVLRERELAAAASSSGEKK